jgi:hypothetical protein
MLDLLRSTLADRLYTFCYLNGCGGGELAEITFGTSSITLPRITALDTSNGRVTSGTTLFAC